MTTVFTIGYEGLTVERFLSQLREHRVQCLVDIRELPLSRKPGFSKRALASIVTAAGLTYVHRRDLGCPKPVRDRYRQDGDWQRYRQGFQAYLGTQQAAINELAGIVASSASALLCYEADFNYCHRSMIADAVRARSGASITHICPAADRKAASAVTRPVSVSADRTG
jgi:uncharacterized protein (DUF488 family)